MNSADANVQFAICVSGEADGDIATWKVYRVVVGWALPPFIKSYCHPIQNTIVFSSFSLK
jgi:hypothetical protein